VPFNQSQVNAQSFIPSNINPMPQSINPSSNPFTLNRPVSQQPNFSAGQALNPIVSKV
jgi:hypothetical protein